MPQGPAWQGRMGDGTGMYSERGLFIDRTWRRHVGDGQAPVHDPHGPVAGASTRSATRAREAVARTRSGMMGVVPFALALVVAEAPLSGVEYSRVEHEGGTDPLDVGFGRVAVR